jgi:CBS domain-containing protein
VRRVKKAQSGMVVDPITIAPDRTLADALALMRAHRISGLPVVDAEHKPIGILTNRDVRFERRSAVPVREVMTRKLVTVRDGVDIEAAKDLLHTHRIEKLLVVDGEGRLRGLITFKDMRAGRAPPDGRGRRARPPARRRRGRHGRRRRGAHRGAAGRRRRRAGGRHRPRSLGRRDEDRARHPPPFPQVQLVAGNVATGRRDQGADGRRRRRRQGRHRARLASAPPASSPASACRS